MYGIASINSSGTANTSLGTTGNTTNLNSSINNIGTGAYTTTNTIGGSQATNDIIGATNINGLYTGTSVTNIGTGGGNTNIGTADSTNTVLGTTGITGTTSINISGSSNTTIGNAANTTTIQSGTNTITGATNTITGVTNTITGTIATNISGARSYSNLNNTNATMGTGSGGMVQTDIDSATVRSSSSTSPDLASNGTSGVMNLGSGSGFTTYNAPRSITSSILDNTGVGILNNKTYTNKINGNLMVDGNVYINGTLDYVSSNSATTSVIGKDDLNTNFKTSNISGAQNATEGGSAIVMKGSKNTTQTVVNANGKISNVKLGNTDQTAAAESSASLTLTNGLGNTHGMVITENQTTLSGGQNSSSMTLGDNGATFSDSATGAPVTVTGVADGRADFDAINVRQFAGAIAAVAAQANIPALSAGQDRTFGIGVGGFMGKSALAMGMNIRGSGNSVYKATVSSGLNNGMKQTVVGVGGAWGF